MSTINTSFSDFFTEAAMVLTNAREHPEIAAALDAFGYDAATLQAGQALLDTARDLYDAQIKEYGEQHAATQAFLDASGRADKAYAAHRRLAKIASRGMPSVKPTCISMTANRAPSILGISKPVTFTPLCWLIPKRKPN